MTAIAAAAVSVGLAAGGGMARVHVVEMDASRTPIFPESCVVCGEPHRGGDGTLRMSHEHGRVDFYLYRLARGRSDEPVLDIPAHEACLRGVRNRALLRLALILGAAALVLAAGVALRAGLFFSVMLALIALGPLLYSELMRPVPVEIGLSRGKRIFFFAEGGYAREFARRNGAAAVEEDYSRRRPG